MPDQLGRILVAEDDHALIEMLRMLLEDEGYIVIAATSLAAALTILRGTTVDLVLTDAFSATRKRALDSAHELLRAAGATPVLLCSAHAIDLDEALTAGFCGLIIKPFDIEVLLSQVASFLTAP